MSSNSPFILDRFEYEKVHLYYLPPSIFKILQDTKPSYMIGSRGTGKTTLLHALNWREQIDNPNLRSQLPSEFRLRGYLGVYIRMPSSVAAAIDNWLASKPDDFRGTVFSLYVDLISIEAILSAIADLLARSVFTAAPTLEYQVCRGVIDKFSHLYPLVGDPNRCTFRLRENCIAQKRRLLEAYSIDRIEVSASQLTENFPIGQVGELARTLSQDLGSFCTHGSGQGSEPWHFKICIDETECLSTFHQRTINTAVRL